MLRSVWCVVVDCGRHQEWWGREWEYRLYSRKLENNWLCATLQSSPLVHRGFYKKSPIPRLSAAVLINCGTCDPLHMRINNALWYLLFNLPSQLHCTWQANLKERITVWVARGRGYRSPYKKAVPGCLYELECRRQNDLISNFELCKRCRRNNSLFTRKSMSPCSQTFLSISCSSQNGDLFGRLFHKLL